MCVYEKLNNEEWNLPFTLLKLKSKQCKCVCQKLDEKSKKLTRMKQR